MSAQAQPQDYAQAIYDLAFETWTRQLGDVQKALTKDPALRAMLEDRGVPVQERLTSLAATTRDGLTDPTRKFLGTLLEAGQLNQLDAILVEFERLVRRRAERKVARVSSAVPLTAAEQEAFRTRLTERFGPDLEFEFEVDPSLVGGVYLRVGDQVIDGSVAGKLAALRNRLAA